MPYWLGDQPAAWNNAGRKAAVPIVTQPRHEKITVRSVTMRASWPLPTRGVAVVESRRSAGAVDALADVTVGAVARSPTAISTATHRWFSIHRSALSYARSMGR